MAKIHAIYSASTLHGPMVNCKSYCITLAKWDYLRPGLHPGPLFGEHKLSSSEVSLGLGQENCNLDWKDMFSVDVLVKTVVVS